MQDVYNNLTGSDFLTAGTGVLTTAGTYFGSVEQRKAQEAQAKALREQGLSQIEVAKIMQETERLKLEQAKAGSGTKAGSKTLYIALGIGAVVILGAVIFAVTRKR
jgi:hypothetical protein